MNSYGAILENVLPCPFPSALGLTVGISNLSLDRGKEVKQISAVQNIMECLFTV